MDGSAITPFAWLFMLSSMTAVTLLVTYCYKRILFDDRKRPAEELRPPSTDSAGRGA